MKILFLLLLFAIIFGIEAPGLLKKKYRRELIVFSILLAIGFVLSLFLALGVDLPPVSAIIVQFITRIFKIKP